MRALVVVVVVMTMGVGVLLLIDPFSAMFHIESRFPTDRQITASYVNVGLVHLEDCNLTVSFINDTSLVYAMDIQLYSPTLMSSAFQLTVENYTGFIHVTLIAAVRIRSFNLTLGIGKPYSVAILQGVNLNSTVTYSNGAVLGKDLRYEATGVLRSIFLEDVNFTVGGLTVRVGISSMYHPNMAHIYVDLPPGLNGEFGCMSDPYPYIMHDEG
ncbi:MAG: hypothetical protein C4K49_09745, partial [Candidatus Thorarchaeota archaeon]